jgi:hypothetical protein
LLLLLVGCGRLGFGESIRAGDAGGDASPSPDSVDGAIETLHVATLTASNGDPQDHFGFGLAVSRDGSTIAVGAPHEDSISGAAPGDNSRTDAGAAYVFVRSGSAWIQQAYIKPVTTAQQGYFGVSLALSDDGNTLAVGQPATTTGAGSVHVFTRTGTSWGNEAVVTTNIRDTGDQFGASIAVSGAGDTLVIGAPGESSASNNPSDNTATNAGAAYVFVFNGASWTQQAYLKSPAPAASDQLGWSVACSQDGNTAVAGAPGSGGNTGVAILFARTGTTWASTSQLSEPTSVPGDFYGFSIAMRADGLQVAVGAPGEDSVVPNSGAAYVGTTVFKAPNADDNAQLGVAVAIADDGTVYAGAALEDSATNDQGNNAAMDSGALYGFGSAPLYLKAQMPAVSDNFGQPVAITGDARTLAASAALADPGGIVDSGSVLVRYYAA